MSAFSIASVDKNGINVGAISVSASPPTFTVGDVYVLEVEVDDANGGTSTTEVSIVVRRNLDTNKDGLIEVSNLNQLNVIRYDLDGDGSPIGSATDISAYEDAFGLSTGESAGCLGGCSGYELMNSLDFNE